MNHGIIPLVDSSLVFAALIKRFPFQIELVFTALPNPTTTWRWFLSAYWGKGELHPNHWWRERIDRSGRRSVIGDAHTSVQVYTSLKRLALFRWVIWHYMNWILILRWGSISSGTSVTSSWCSRMDLKLLHVCSWERLPGFSLLLFSDIDVALHWPMGIKSAMKTLFHIQKSLFSLGIRGLVPWYGCLATSVFIMSISGFKLCLRIGGFWLFLSTYFHQ